MRPAPGPDGGEVQHAAKNVARLRDSLVAALCRDDWGDRDPRGYSRLSQTISELSAIGAPTRSLWMLLGAVYTVLVTAFGWGVWKSAGRDRALRIVGGLLVAYGSLGLLWPFAPMHLREVLAAGGGTLSDTMHIVLASATVLLMFLAMGFAASVFGKRFRLYSIASIVDPRRVWRVDVLGCAPRPANLPTPWIGLWERINISVFLLWVVVLAIVLLRREERAAEIGRGAASARPRVDGQVSRGFEPVREAFVDNFARRHELGGACCAYHHGEIAVDLWGGSRNKQTGEPWEQNTMVVVHSATKGLAAMTLAVAHSRGWLDYEERVCAYWPEFAQQGKERITVRQLLAHQAGLFAINEPVDRSIVADLDRLAAVLARQKPAWEPGTRQAYHALTLGFYEGELLRRIDPKRRSLGQFFQDEIASPLGLDLYLRLPDAIPNSRLASIAPPGRMQMLVGFPFRFALDVMNPRSNIYRALVINPGQACTWINSASTPASWKCRRGMPSARRGRSRAPTACSRRADASSGCAQRRSSCWLHPRSRRRTGSMTSACEARCSSRWGS